MSAESDRAELATLRAQLDDLIVRVEAVATRYEESDDSAVADDLFGAERSLVSARRLIERAIGRLDA
jgi:hypothetical protein